MKKSCLFFGMLAFAVSAFAAEFRIEPEFFNDLKFWRKSLDANTSGRCQITADKTVKNTISETYQLPEAGTYYIWVRSFSYGANSRKFKLFLNNKGLGSFGDGVIPAGQESPSLCWEKAKKNTRTSRRRSQSPDLADLPLQPHRHGDFDDRRRFRALQRQDGDRCRDRIASAENGSR